MIIQHPELTIGNHCNFGAYNHITCTNKVTIGDNLLTGKWVTITDNSQGATDYASLQVEPLRTRSDIADLSHLGHRNSDPRNFAKYYRQYSNPGVGEHPSDYGFEQIAKMLLVAIN